MVSASIRPSGPRAERGVTMTQVGRVEAVISCPESPKKLANPTPAAPRVSHPVAAHLWPLSVPGRRRRV